MTALATSEWSKRKPEALANALVGLVVATVAPATQPTEDVVDELRRGIPENRDADDTATQDGRQRVEVLPLAQPEVAPCRGSTPRRGSEELDRVVSQACSLGLAAGGKATPQGLGLVDGQPRQGATALGRGRVELAGRDAPRAHQRTGLDVDVLEPAVGDAHERTEQATLADDDLVGQLDPRDRRDLPDDEPRAPGEEGRCTPAPIQNQGDTSTARTAKATRNGVSHTKSVMSRTVRRAGLTGRHGSSSPRRVTAAGSSGVVMAQACQPTRGM